MPVLSIYYIDALNFEPVLIETWVRQEMTADVIAACLQSKDAEQAGVSYAESAGFDIIVFLRAEQCFVARTRGLGPNDEDNFCFPGCWSVG